MLTTISDRKIHNTGSGAPFLAEVMTSQDYYPFGMLMPARVYNSAGYRFGFNGQEKVDEWDGSGCQLAFEYRIEDTRISKFLSVDPMVKTYPWNSPYAFAENRPIDGKDWEGKEWDKCTDDQGNTNVSVNTSFSVEPDAGLSIDQITDYQNAISDQLGNTLNSSTNGSMSGSVSFNGANGSDRLVPSISLGINGDPTIGGLTSHGSISVNLCNPNGTMKTPTEVAEDVVHELMHTLRIEHPFEQTQGQDTKLTSDGGNNYLTTPSTDPNISFNLMIYPMIKIDGVSYYERNSTTPKTMLTCDQIDLMLHEVDMQKQGFGAFKYKNSESLEENENRYNEYYQNYWDNSPGQTVPKKK